MPTYQYKALSQYERRTQEFSFMFFNKRKYHKADSKKKKKKKITSPKTAL